MKVKDMIRKVRGAWMRLTRTKAKAERRMQAFEERMRLEDAARKESIRRNGCRRCHQFLPFEGSEWNGECMEYAFGWGCGAFDCPLAEVNPWLPDAGVAVDE